MDPKTQKLVVRVLCALLILLLILGIAVPAFADVSSARVVIGADLSDEQIGAELERPAPRHGGPAPMEHAGEKAQQSAQANGEKCTNGHIHTPCVTNNRSIYCESAASTVKI